MNRRHRDLDQLGRNLGLGGLVLRTLHHEVVTSVSACPHRPAEVHIPAGQARQLQRHMLGDVAEVGPARHRFGEAAGATGRAVVIGETGQGRGQPPGEARVVGGLPARQLVELDPGDADRLGGEDVRSAQMTQVFQAHVTLLGWC